MVEMAGEVVAGIICMVVDRSNINSGINECGLQPFAM
jgi:hypothetical protein